MSDKYEEYMKKEPAHPIQQIAEIIAELKAKANELGGEVDTRDIEKRLKELMAAQRS